MAITNLTGSKWVFKEILNLSTDGFYYNINFISNSLEYDQLINEHPDFGYRSVADGNTFYVYSTENNMWVTGSTYRTIEITGGGDVENADLIAFLQANATLILPNFNETKTALKIYEDLTPVEYEGLEKEPNSFYLVNNVGVYKGNKLLATSVDSSSYQRRLDKPSNVYWPGDSFSILTPGTWVMIKFRNVDDNLENQVVGVFKKYSGQTLLIDTIPTRTYNADGDNALVINAELDGKNLFLTVIVENRVEWENIQPPLISVSVY